MSDDTECIHGTECDECRTMRNHRKTVKQREFNIDLRNADKYRTEFQLVQKFVKWYEKLMSVQ
jgi:hypothetical protein